jgi:hypothetical protein
VLIDCSDYTCSYWPQLYATGGPTMSSCPIQNLALSATACGRAVVDVRHPRRRAGIRSIVAPIHPKAMPVILTTEEEYDVSIASAMG